MSERRVCRVLGQHRFKKAKHAVGEGRIGRNRDKRDARVPHECVINFSHIFAQERFAAGQRKLQQRA